MKAIAFDLDGTLIDSAEDIGLCLRKTLEEIGIPDKMPRDVRELIGGGVKALLQRVLGAEFREEHVKVFRKHYLANPVVYTRPFEGIPEALKVLKDRGFTLLVVTNKMEDLSREILKILGLLKYFDFIVGGDTYGEKKPSPLPLVNALKEVGLAPDQSLMVGDTDSDIISARSAGAMTALAVWGYCGSVTQKPDFILKKPEEIISLTGRVSGA